MSFNAALSGLKSASSDLDVVSNNVANASTTGFKKSRAEFSEVFSSSSLGSSSQIGSGSRLSNISQQFAQGNLINTDNPLDLAINGDGFFRMHAGDTIVYSRSGAYSVDREGYLVNNLGFQLSGYTTDVTGNLSGTLAPLQVDTANLPPSATTAAELNLNIPANDSVPPITGGIVPTNSNTYNDATSLTVYDSLGNPRNMTVYFAKDTVSNTWNYNLELDGTSFNNVTINGGAAGASGQISFDSNGLALGGVATSAIPITVDLDGVEQEVTGDATAVSGATSPLSFDLDLSRLTQYGNPFSVNGLIQDGFASARFVGLDVENNGMVVSRFSNGQSSVLGQVALANFSNPQALKNFGETSWTETLTSGAAQVGAPGSASLGLLSSGTLEESNVDMTSELVRMITAQRNFQANAQVIRTTDQVTQTIINIR